VAKWWRLWGSKTFSEIRKHYFRDWLDVSPTPCELCVYAKRIQVSKYGATPMPNNDNKTNEKILRDAFRAMDPHQAQEIREAYYKAIEGLRTLADTLEIADTQQPQTAGPLLTEHLYACEALDAMRCSLLGKIL
jgi:hypothetical protein